MATSRGGNNVPNTEYEIRPRCPGRIDLTRPSRVEHLYGKRYLVYVCPLCSGNHWLPMSETLRLPPDITMPCGARAVLPVT